MIEDHANTKAQPAPVGGGASVTDAVIVDMLQRREQGTKKYGIELTTHNGRDAEVDAYQEALDLVMYQKQRLMERDRPRTLDELAGDAVTAIGAVFNFADDERLTVRRQLRDLADYAASCIEALDRR